MNIKILFICVMVATVSTNVQATNYIQMQRVYPDPLDRNLEFFTVVGVNHVVKSTFDTNLKATFWVRWVGDLDWQRIEVAATFTTKQSIKLEVTGYLVGTAYIFSNNNPGMWGTYSYVNDDPNSARYATSSGGATGNIFSYVRPTVWYDPSAGGGTITVEEGSGTGGSTVTEFEPTTPMNDKTDESGAIKIEKQEYTTGQTSEFWNDWKVKIDNIPTYANGKNLMKLGNVQSKGEGWDDTAEVTFDGTWYKTSSVKSFIDAAMTGFAAFAALLMPYYELKKGAPNG